MELTLSGYEKKLAGEFKPLPFEKLLFFGTWCCEYMDSKYGSYFNERGLDKARKTLTDAISFLWSAVDHPSEIKDTDIKTQLKKVENVSVGDLDFAIPEECAILKMLESVETMLNFSKNKQVKYIVAVAAYPLDVIETNINSKLDPYTTPPETDVNHPLIKEELDAQKKLTAYLKTNEGLTSADKHIFRS
jgi:hypothetical protein